MKHLPKSLFFPAMLALCLAAVSPATVAAGLAPIKVNSALGQPFSAEIEITGLPAEEFEFDLAKGRLASPEAYEDAKLAFPPYLRQLRITTERHSDGRPYLKLVSGAPINEPAMNLLVEFNWRAGRLVQKYSILLDPPK
jgi:pilus assembly protein FimV